VISLPIVHKAVVKGINTAFLGGLSKAVERSGSK